MKVLLIDGDIVLFQVAFKSQQKMFDKLIVDDIIIAQERIDDFIRDLVQRTEAREYLVCLSGFNNFRKQLSSTYKLNRADKEKPELLSELRAYVEAEYPCLYIDNLEADDVIGILVSKRDKEYIIASTDKDMQQISSTHYNWRKDTLFTITPEEATRFFYQLVLQGDPGDGYYGVPGIGKVKARKLLDEVEPEHYWKAVVETYLSHGLTYDDALMTARLAFILDKDHYDCKTKSVKLWTPPKEKEVEQKW